MIYILDPIAESAVNMLEKHFDVVNYPQSLNSDWRQNARAIVVRVAPIHATDIKAAKNLKIISKHGVGLDNIDIIAAEQAGVKVTNTPGANARSVSELVIAFSLALSRQLIQSDSNIKNGHWKLPEKAIEISGKTIGLIGIGSVGKETAQIFKNGFGCSICAYDPFAEVDIFTTYGIKRCATVDDVLSQSDIVSVHVPLTSDTKMMIGEKQFNLMKKDAFLINVARGGIVDEDALYNALQSGRIAAAASDVFADEPVMHNNKLLTLSNFIASPHTGGNTDDSLQRVGLAAAQNIIDHLAI